MPRRGDLPDRQKNVARENLSSPARKNISLPVTPKSVASLRHPASSKRGVRVVTNVEAGCGGRGGVEKTSDAAADGEIVWSWRSDAGAKVVKTLPASHGRRWQPSMVTGEIAYKP